MHDLYVAWPEVLVLLACLRFCGLRLAACGLRLAACGLRIADCGLRIADCGLLDCLRIADCGLRIADFLLNVVRAYRTAQASVRMIRIMSRLSNIVFTQL